MPHRITGRDKCTHINKKTGLQDCNKKGRFNSKPMMSWNNQRRYDIELGRKRKYYQFIHNDGTRHNIGSFEQHRLNEMEGQRASGDVFKRLHIFANGLHGIGDLFFKIAQASLRWYFEEGEERFLRDALRQGDFEPIIKKYQQYERQRRQQIYKDSRDENQEKHRYYGTLEFEQINRITINLLNLSREDFKLQLSKLTEDEFIKVNQRMVELINGFEKWLSDRRELFKEVAREKFNGNIPPELERKMSARY